MLRQHLPAPGLLPYVRLMRPANVVTAAADVLAGFALAGLAAPTALPALVGAGMALYAGGVVLNDVCDARLDAVERPERPIPSGAASRPAATALALALLALGVTWGFAAGAISGMVAVVLATLVVGYDAWGKHRSLLGPLNMGACRGASLLLGASAAPAALLGLWPVALIAVAYIAAITAISRGEVHGGRRGTGLVALGLLAGVLAGLAALGLRPESIGWALAPFWALFAWRVVPPFVAAWREPAPGTIRAAVGAGVLSLVVLDAAIAAAFAGPLYGLGVLALLPVAEGLRRLFAVT